MELGDFNDFVNTLTPDVIAENTADASDLCSDYRKTMPDSGFGNQVALLSFTIALELLGTYHKWLEQQP